MSVSGNYIGHYSWGCGSNYGQFNITFNPNGTFGGVGSTGWDARTVGIVAAAPHAQTKQSHDPSGNPT
jgi:hypothetical protein